LPERPYLSIGEVLSLLKEEFSDITISKIRFLESQGLIDPERTPSGYRKFYDSDVERLRWILRQQREHFLPLKVIKGRLNEGDEEEPGVEEEEDHDTVLVPAAAAPPAGELAAPADGGTTRTSGRRRLVAGGMRGPGLAGRPTVPANSEPREPAAPMDPGPTGTHLTIEEIASACGLVVSGIQELERYGLLAGKAVAGTVYYDEEALIAARLAAGFLRFGVEARHLRMYKTAAEREAGLFEQVVMPLLKQRNPQARQQAAATLSELAGLGQSLRATMLRQALRDTTGA